MSKTMSDANEIEVHRDVVYATHDGVQLSGDLCLPKGGGPFPALVAVHGGGWRLGARSSFQYWGPHLAARGYALFAISYRLAARGRKTYPQAINDVCAAVQFVRGEAKGFNIDGERIALMGASAGALEVLSNLLPALPSDYRLPILIVVHLPPDKTSLFAELMRTRCAIRVREAEDKEPIEPGVAYFAPPDYHLRVEQDKRLSLSDDEPVLFSRPSIDVLFESAADAYGGGLIGVVLTGANSDGANGLKAVVEAGGVAVVQSPGSAYAVAMPEAAIAACPEARVLPVNEIAAYLREVGAR